MAELPRYEITLEVVKRYHKVVRARDARDAAAHAVDSLAVELGIPATEIRLRDWELLPGKGVNGK